MGNHPSKGPRLWRWQSHETHGLVLASKRGDPSSGAVGWRFSLYAPDADTPMTECEFDKNMGWNCEPGTASR